MKKILSLVILSIILVGGIFIAPVQTQTRSDFIEMLQDKSFVREIATALQKYKAEAVEQVAQSVVNITIRKMRNLDGSPSSMQDIAFGSGFIVSDTGYIVTNRHVVIADLGITDVKKLSVMLQYKIRLNNDREYSARLVAIHPETDLAILQLQEVTEELQAVSFGDSDLLYNAMEVCAMGSPMGLKKSVTCGVISNPKQISENLDTRFHPFIQTDTAINQGNSGGPLFDAITGEVVGVNTLIVSRNGTNIGLGFAIPSNVVAPWVEAVLSGYGSVDRNGWIGIKTIRLNPQIKALFKSPTEVGNTRTKGLFVVKIDESGPAYQKLQRNDIILLLNGKAVADDPGRLLLDIQNLGKGKKLTLTIFRDDTIQEIIMWTERNPK